MTVAVANHHARPTTSNGTLPGSALALSGSGTSEAVKVIVRCRPLSQMEIAQGHGSIVAMDTERGVVEVKNPKEQDSPPKCFTFDAIYDQNSKQMDLYYETFRELVDSVLNGFNGTIFAYGQTGTGKTFTMEGVREDPDLRGVIPNAIDHIFRHISQSTNQQYLVRASYLEIYQEEIRDLLDRKGDKRRLELKERPDTGVYVKDLTSFVTKSAEEIVHVMTVGNMNRSVGRTNMNEHSSRSHAIFVITVECSEEGEDGENHIRVGRLNLVDLAGSERQSKTGAEGERFKEATKINLSLSALGNVISALVDGKSAHIPYRDSKLTRLLQDSLGGNSKTVMVANVGPASYNYEETLSTLRYANRAKNIKNKPRINEDPKDALLREFQDEILRLKSMLEKRGGSATSRRRRRHHDDQRPDTASTEGNHSTSVEAQLMEQERKLEEERQKVLRDNEIIEEEKRRMLDRLEDRAKQIAEERKAQDAVAEKIRAMQSKLLSGDGNLTDQTRQQQQLLQQRRIELAEQRRKEREILQQLEAQEDNTAEIHQTFANLRQEVEVKTKKLQKFITKLQHIRLEMQDNDEANSRERQALEESISEMNKDLKLKWLIVENFIPSAVVDSLRGRLYFDEEESRWLPVQSSVNRSQTPDAMLSALPEQQPATKIPTAMNGFRGMFDSGIGPSDGSDVGSSSASHAGNEKASLKNRKRPLSMTGLRRPMSDCERVALARLRQRIVRSTHSALAATSSHFDENHSAISAILSRTLQGASESTVPDELMRFGGENILVFSSLVLYPSEVREVAPEFLAEKSFSESAAQSEKFDNWFKKRACPQRAWKGDRGWWYGGTVDKDSDSDAASQCDFGVPEGTRSRLGKRWAALRRRRRNTGMRQLRLDDDPLPCTPLHDTTKFETATAAIWASSFTSSFSSYLSSPASPLHDGVQEEDLSSSTTLPLQSPCKRYCLTDRIVSLPPRPSRIPTLMTQSVFTRSARTDVSPAGWRMTQSVCTHQLSVMSSAMGSCERLAEIRVTPRQETEMLLSRLRLRSSIASCYTHPALSRPLRHFSHTRSNRHSLPREVACSYTKDASVSVLLPTTGPINTDSHVLSDNSATDRPSRCSHDRLEQRLRLYKAQSSRCAKCRFDRALLSRMREVKTQRNALSVKVSKHSVCRRDPCRCERKTRSLSTPPTGASPMQVTAAANRFATVERCYGGIVISSAVALICQLLLSLVFTDCSRC